MKKIILILFVLVNKSFSQDTIHYPKPNNFRKMYFEGYKEIPLKDLKNKYKSAYHTAIWFRNKVNDKNFIDFGLDLGFLEKPRLIEYKYQDSIIKLESNKVNLKVGFRHSYVINFNRKKSILSEFCTTVGWSALYYTVPKREKKLKEDFKKTSDLHTFFVSEYFKLNYKDFGLLVGYNCSPYTIFSKNFESKFGSESYVFGFTYKF